MIALSYRAFQAQRSRRPLPCSLWVALWIFIIVAPWGCVEDVHLGGRDVRPPTVDQASDDTAIPTPDKGTPVPDVHPTPDKDVADAYACTGPPPCNWCGGEHIIDTHGCVVGYKCNNGVDPCVVSPCDPKTGTGCQTGEVCKDDKLCWPAHPDAALPQDFACGASATCAVGAEYCLEHIPDPCSGGPVPDSGQCPAHCKEVTCPGPKLLCHCTTFTCEVLPGGCTTCACMSIGGGCQCTDIKTGGVLVQCPI